MIYFVPLVYPESKTTFCKILELIDLANIFFLEESD